MLFENEYSPPERPEYKPLRKSDENDSALLFAIHTLADQGLLDSQTRIEYGVILASPLTLSQQLAAWRARRKANG